MKGILLLFILLLIADNASAQKHKRRPPPPPGLHFFDGCKCKDFNRYCPEERNAFFPFNKAEKIVLISFLSWGDSTRAVLGGNYALFNKDTLGYKKVRDLKQLNQAETDEFSGMMFNVFHTNYFEKRRKIVCLSSPAYACYEPRNAAIFLDKRDSIVAKIEICFHCNLAVTIPVNMSLNNCDNELSLYQDFFLKSGIDWGALASYDDR